MAFCDLVIYIKYHSHVKACENVQLLLGSTVYGSSSSSSNRKSFVWIKRYSQNVIRSIFFELNTGILNYVTVSKNDNGLGNSMLGTFFVWKFIYFSKGFVWIFEKEKNWYVKSLRWKRILKSIIVIRTHYMMVLQLLWLRLKFLME